MPVEILICLKADGEGRLSKGWSEKHLYMNEVSELKDLADTMKRLADKRLGVAAGNIWLTEIRASRPGVWRDSYRVFSKFGGDSDSPIQGNGQLKDFQSDPTNSCLNVVFYANDVQRKTLYLAGIPDPLIRLSPPGPDYNAVPDFMKGWRAYRDLLCNGSWGFKARALANPSFAVPIYDWQIQPEAPFELVAIIPSEDDFAGVGDDVQVRNVKGVNRGVRVPNGKWAVRGKAQVGILMQYTLRNAVGYDPTQFMKPGSVEPIMWQDAIYVEGKIVGQATRKRGVGPVRPRGRLSPRRK